MLVADLDGVSHINVNDKSKAAIAGLPGEALALDYDPVTDFIYWSNVLSIRRVRLEGTYGLKLDNHGGNIYWSDFSKDTISVTRKDGSFTKTLLNSTVIEDPMMLALDPRNGLMYWVVNKRNNKRIDSAAMDGSNYTTVIRNLTFPLAIAIDYRENRLYYSDDNSIFSSDMLGNDIRLVTTLLGEDSPEVSAIAVDDNYIYWTQQFPDKIQR
ncbi:low-density lipoprotein receptor-related protein 5-like protein [Branchiostoma floridae x Branchiostoma belcheri]